MVDSLILHGGAQGLERLCHLTEAIELRFKPRLVWLKAHVFSIAEKFWNFLINSDKKEMLSLTDMFQQNSMVQILYYFQNPM